MPAYGCVLISTRLLGVINNYKVSREWFNNMYISSELYYNLTDTVPRTNLICQELYASSAVQVLHVKYQFNVDSNIGDLLIRDKYVTA